MTSNGLSTPTLASLMQSRKEATGKSYRQIASEAGVATSTVHKMASGRLQTIPDWRIAEAVAASLEIDVVVLMEAIAHDLGLREFNKDEAERDAIYLGLANLTNHQRRNVLAEIAELQRLNDLVSSKDPSTPPYRFDADGERRSGLDRRKPKVDDVATDPHLTRRPRGPRR